MKVLGIKRIWKQWVATMLVVVMATMTPFQSAAGLVNRHQAENEMKEEESALTNDGAMGDYRQIGTPSDTEPEDDMESEQSTPSDAEPEEDMELEPATPSNGDMLRTNQSYVVKFYVGSELWDTQEVAPGECANEPAPPEKDGYTFVGWGTDYTNVVRNLSTYAQFKKGTYQTHKVTFMDDDGRWLSNAQYVIHGLDARRPDSPKRDGYTFVGWDKQRFCIKKDTVITAQYREGTLDIYFLQYGGRCPDKTSAYNILKEEWIVKGEDGSPPVPEEVPGHTFHAWPYPESYTNVQKNDTIYARYYAGDVKTHKVEFVDYDGRVLYAPQQIANGQDANRPPSPKRDGYTFVGWDKQRFCIREDTVMTAQYREGALDICFLQYGGRCPDKTSAYNILKEEWIVKGEDGSPPVPEEVPGYTFHAWPYPESYTNVQKNDTIYARYYVGDVKTHKVEFVDYDGRVLYAPQQIANGQDANRPPSPKRDGYTFVGWSNQRFCIREDTVMTAQYREGALDICFLQYGGRCPDKTSAYNILKEEWIVKGEDGSPPVPEEVPGYTFHAWPYAENYINVQKNDTIYASYYTGDIKTHKVKFVDYDGRILSAPQQIAIGKDANRPPSPKRDGYTFVGWDKQRFCIKKDTVITAQYREGTLDIYFLLYRGRCPDKSSGAHHILKEEWIVKGEDGAPPVPEQVPGYTFHAWPYPEYYMNVQKNDTIYASYYAGDVKTHKVEFVDYDGRVLYAPQYIANGKDAYQPPFPKREGYTFTGWDQRFNSITAPKRIRAVYIPGIYNTQKVQFYGKIIGEERWVVLKEEWVPIGGDATPPVPPAYVGYVFTGWGSSYTNIQSAKNIYATYKTEDSVTGEDKLRIFKSLISQLDLTDELEEALIELGTYLAMGDKGEGTARAAIAIPIALYYVIAALLTFYTVYETRRIYNSIGDSITISFGVDAVPAVDQIWWAYEKILSEGGSEGDSEADADIPEKDIKDLPQNAQDAYGKYNDAGWKGNVAGQTEGTKAGGKYDNDDRQLPQKDTEGNQIEYKEWDVNNKQPGSNRDGERFVTGSDGSIYYTDSHYGQGSSPTNLPPFVRIK